MYEGAFKSNLGSGQWARFAYSEGQLALVNASELDHRNSREYNRRIVIVVAEIKGVKARKPIRVSRCRAGATESCLCRIGTGVAVQEACIVFVALRAFILALMSFQMEVLKTVNNCYGGRVYCVGA